MTGAVITPLEPAALKPGAKIRIIPDGLFRTSDVRPVNVPHWKMDAAIAERLIQKWREGVEPQFIDYEHQSLLKEKNGQPAPAAGWYHGLEYRNGEGLFITDIKWTPRAQSMIHAGEYRFISPVFSFDLSSGDVTVLHSVALTNTPALPGLVDLASASALPVNNSSTLLQSTEISAEDRAKLKLVFGDIPGFDVDALMSNPSPTSLTSLVDQKLWATKVSAEDYAKLKHAFGDLPGFDDF